MTQENLKTSSRKQEKRFDEYEQSKPIQLTLFSTLGIDTAYSRTIEFYDFIPKYAWGRIERIKVEKANKEILPNLERTFVCRDIVYHVTIIPASVRGADGVFRDYFPSKREELVEDALRKIACETTNSIFLDGEASVTFTLYKLKKELRKRKHGYSIDEIKEALFILSGTNLEITSDKGTTILKSNIFQTLGLQTQDDWKGNGNKIKGFVRFNPLVTKAINHMKFRQLEYETSMSFQNYLARQLFKRMSHHYIQASITNRYNITLLTIIRDFGVSRYEQLRDNLREVVKALEELKAKQVIADYTVEKILASQQHNKLIDAKFTILTTPQFNAEIKHANAKSHTPDHLIPTEEVFP
jgi:hypothetical protein